MNDLISRQAALALAKDICVPIKDGTVYRHRCIDPQQIMDLPSVEKHGTWIKKMRVAETEKYVSYEPEWYCACCGTKYDSHIAKVVNFCYVCGADMRERKEE